jgi:hypothetical protein
VEGLEGEDGDEGAGHGGEVRSEKWEVRRGGKLEIVNSK